MQKIKLKKGDVVKVLAGKEQGKSGKILKFSKDRTRAFVEKLSMVKRHTRPDAKGKGGIMEKEAAIHLSNLALVCRKCDSVARVGYRLLEDGRRVRVCKKCKEMHDE
jgi:large subunit ribosomal protein L24